jgi:RimJ/RimL family protein N-acetyltransferase
MRLEDLDDVADVHKNCFPIDVSIFSALSPDILKHYYAMFIEESESYAAVLEEPASGRVVGFAFGTQRPGIQKRFLKRYYFKFFWSIIMGLLTGRTVWKAIWLRLRGKSSLQLGKYDSILAQAGVPSPEGPEDLQMGIGVHKDYRGGGNAERLIDYYVTRVFEKGVVRIRGAVLTRNVASMILFKRCGWEIKEISNTEVSIWLDRPKKI